MITRFYFKACLCLAMLSLIATLSSSPAYTAPHTTPPQAPSVTSSTSSTTLTGWLTAVWGDSQTGEALPPLFRLTEQSGRAYQLQLDNALFNPQLVGQQVTVEGQFLAERAADAEPIFEVTELNPAASADSTADENEVIGSQPWVSILCKFPDVAEPQHDLAYFQGMYTPNQYPNMDHYWRELSYNQMNLEGSTAVGWYTLPQPHNYYAIDWPAKIFSLFDDCVAAADAEVDFTQFAGINLMFNGQMMSAHGGQIWSSLDGEDRLWRTTWLPFWAYEKAAVVDHEMGHGFGLPHSFDNNGFEYGNAWDVMSDTWNNCHLHIDPTYGCLGQHTISFHKEILGWIPPERQHVVYQGEQTTVTVEQLALPAENSNPLLIKLPLGVATATNFITIEARRLAGYDQRLPEPAVVLHQIDNSVATLLTSLMVGESYIDPSGQITVTVTAETATGFVVDVTHAPYSCAGQEVIPQSECEALTAFYNSLDGNNWELKLNWFSGSPCDWYGVYCENGHVIQLNYFSNGLKGELTPELANLADLQNFYLTDNEISGSIPLFLTSLPRLRFLSLGYNQFSGAIPPEIGNLETLEELNLAHNHLEGSIPAELGNLSALIHLDLSHNQLTGFIPETFTQLHNLYSLNLSNNELAEGHVPIELIDLPFLGVLNLSHNNFVGEIPAEIANLTALGSLNLSGNQLTGEIPSELEDLESLGYLYLAENQLTGEIPASLGHISTLDLHDNLLTGSIPNLHPTLYELNLANNQLTGSIPPELFNLKLRTLNLKHNQFTGTIPSEINQTFELGYLDLSENQLQGSLLINPYLISLYYLDVSHNQFSGELPTELVHGGILQTLDLGYNAFTAHNRVLRQYLQQFDPDWEQTQTAAPQSVQIVAHTDSSVQLNWQRPLYTADGGYYEISYATSPSGPFTVHGLTADKQTTSYVVDNLQPETMYYFQVRAFTPAHDLQQNELWSAYSNLAFIPVAQVYLPVILQP